MSEETYVIWDYQMKAYVAKDPGQTTLDLDNARRYSRDAAVGFCYGINKDLKRDELAYALSPECGGNPTFHLPPPENVFKEVEALRARVAELEAILTKNTTYCLPYIDRELHDQDMLHTNLIFEMEREDSDSIIAAYDKFCQVSEGYVAAYLPKGLKKYGGYEDDEYKLVGFFETEEEAKSALDKVKRDDNDQQTPNV